MLGDADDVRSIRLLCLVLPIAYYFVCVCVCADDGVYTHTRKTNPPRGRDLAKKDNQRKIQESVCI